MTKFRWWNQKYSMPLIWLHDILRYKLINEAIQFRMSLKIFLREFRGKDLPFGGLQVIFLGDSLQLPPIEMPKNGIFGTNFCLSIRYLLYKNILFAFIFYKEKRNISVFKAKRGLTQACQKTPSYSMKLFANKVTKFTCNCWTRFGKEFWHLSMKSFYKNV